LDHFAVELQRANDPQRQKLTVLTQAINDGPADIGTGGREEPVPIAAALLPYLEEALGMSTNMAADDPRCCEHC
jgi:hypothetical protein